MQKSIDKLQTTAGLSRQVQCIIGLFASAPRKSTLERAFTQIHRMHVGYFYFLAFTGTTQQRNESWQSIFCVFALHKFVGSIISTSGDPSLTFAHLCHGALWSCIWPRWCWNMMKKAETLPQTHTTWYMKAYVVSSILMLTLDGRVWYWYSKFGVSCFGGWWERCIACAALRDVHFSIQSNCKGFYVISTLVWKCLLHNPIISGAAISRNVQMIFKSLAY